MASAVDDLDAEGLVLRGIVDPAPGGTPLARFFFVADPEGYQIEVLRRAGRCR